MRDVLVRLSYVDDLKAGLPISYLEFWFAKQAEIDDQARAAFEALGHQKSTRISTSNVEPIRIET